VPGLGASFGRGGATMPLQDLKNADAILIMGSSMAEQHPVGFRFVVDARERGAKVIHVDPRYTRTSAMSDLWVPLRPGSDIVFLGALVNYVLGNGREFREYVAHYTNAGTILREDVRLPDDLDGLFSGWNPEARQYDPETWTYARATIGARDKAKKAKDAGGHGKGRGGEASNIGEFTRDLTLQHPRCVFQVLKRHFSRYTPEMVERACGVPRDLFVEVADAYTSASGPERTGAICYAVGWTQHSAGVQVIRTAAILQLLLGNVGRPGGGILALRGHASIQGSTDIPTLFDVLPGYLPMPLFDVDSKGLADYVRAHGSRTGWWANFDKYFVSLMKAYYGEAATPDNDFGFEWVPKITGDHSHLAYWLDMMDGKIEGLFVMGQNPAVGAPHSRLERTALSRLKWLVVRDMVEIETASFWYDSPEVERGELSPARVPTEVFLFPAAGHAEKDGTFTNTQRLLQWRERAVDPPGNARSEAWFIYHLGRRLKEKARRDPRPRHAGLNALTWAYPTEGPHQEPVVSEILKEIHGWYTADGSLVDSLADLRSDGSTACGCWIYSGVYRGGENRASERDPHGPYGHGWGFTWPLDRRVIYNRASAAPDGSPWSERKKLVWWDASAGRWTGDDEPDFKVDKRPDQPADPKASGDAALPGDAPFLLHEDGVAWLWVPSGIKDGPLPAHYESFESPVRNPLYAQQDNPAADRKSRPDNRYASSPDARFPFVLTTYRLTEHHTAGGMSRTLSHLAELQPELFCEISPELAALVGVRHHGWATIVTTRGIIEARALVTSRIPPLRLDGGRVVHQVGLPYHWGSKGLVRGDTVNDLVPISQEPNVRIFESKALLCNIRPGRRPRGPDALRELEAVMQRRP
jgi:formate dehydrogenase major subunit